MEQGFGSLLTFGVNLWLIRNGAAAAYGTYVFWLSVAFAGGVVEGTLVLAHLSRLPSALDRMADRLEPERFMLSVTLAVLCAVMAVVAVGVWLLARAGSELAAAPAILFTPAFLLFQYVRTYAFSRQRPALAAGLSGAILVVTAPGTRAGLCRRPPAERRSCAVADGPGVRRRVGGRAAHLARRHQADVALARVAAAGPRDARLWLADAWRRVQ